MTNSFTVRVELRGTPSGTDYQALHAAMIANGFKRTVEINGRSFHLPHAEYDFEAELSAFQVADIAKPIINPIWKDYLILVTTATERAGVLVPVA